MGFGRDLPLALPVSFDILSLKECAELYLVRERTAAESERRVLRRQEIQDIEMEEYVGIAMGA